MKKTMISVVNCICFILLLTFVGVYATFYSRPDFSEIEKRELISFPQFNWQQYLDGTFNRDISTFFADTFPARDGFVRLSNVIKEASGVRYGNVRFHDVAPAEPLVELDNVNIPSDSTSSSTEEPLISQSSTPDESSQPSSQPQTFEEGVKHGAIYVYKGKGYQIFGGSNTMGTSYANVINKYSEALGEDVAIYNLVVPSPIEFGVPAFLKSTTAEERPKIENIIASLNGKVKGINVYDILNSHKDEYIYFATDHHWTSLGAYYAYEEFCKAANLTPIDINTLEKRTLEGFLGTLYSQTQDSSMLANTDHVDYYMMPSVTSVNTYMKDNPFSPHTMSLYGEYARPINSYSVFLHGDFPLSIINTNVNNGKKVMVVKESYGNAFVPFLTNNYSQVYVVDQRYFQLGLVEFIKQEQIDDLLFINNIFAAHTPVHINELSRIMYQQYVPPAPKPAEEVITDEMSQSESQAESSSEESSEE